jgi:DNA-binding response OmpR family regulator
VAHEKLTGNVLVCDDDPDARSIVAQVLLSEGYVVTEAADGAIAQELCRKSLPDVVVMDIMMPNVTGLEFVIWLRATCTSRYVPVVLLTALTDRESLVNGLDTGADDYLTKPYHYRELLARVRALFRVKQLMENLVSRSEELARANQMLIETQTALLSKERELVAARMAATTAHNLGQPITSIMLNLNLLEREIASPEDSALERVRAIHSECDVVRNILLRLQEVDPERASTYIGESQIFELPEQPTAPGEKT